MPEKKKNDFGVSSLILGIASILLSPSIVLGIAAGIVGIVFAVKQRKIYENGISVAGLVTSIVGLVLSFLLIVLFILFWIPFASYTAQI